MNIKTILLLVVIGIAAFILFGFVNESRALDQSQPQETPVLELVEPQEFSGDPGLRPEPVSIEYLYLRLKVDWEDKNDITSFASLACYDFSGEKKIECYGEHKYFDKKQISEKALDVFVEFRQEHDVY